LSCERSVFFHPVIERASNSGEYLHYVGRGGRWRHNGRVGKAGRKSQSSKAQSANQAVWARPRWYATWSCPGCPLVPFAVYAVAAPGGGLCPSQKRGCRPSGITENVAEKTRRDVPQWSRSRFLRGTWRMFSMSVGIPKRCIYISNVSRALTSVRTPPMSRSNIFFGCRRKTIVSLQLRSGLSNGTRVRRHQHFVFGSIIRSLCNRTGDRTGANSTCLPQSLLEAPHANPPSRGGRDHAQRC